MPYFELVPKFENIKSSAVFDFLGGYDIANNKYIIYEKRKNFSCKVNVGFYIKDGKVEFKKMQFIKASPKIFMICKFYYQHEDKIYKSLLPNFAKKLSTWYPHVTKSMLNKYNLYKSIKYRDPFLNIYDGNVYEMFEYFEDELYVTEIFVSYSVTHQNNTKYIVEIISKYERLEEFENFKEYLIAFPNILDFDHNFMINQIMDDIDKILNY